MFLNRIYTLVVLLCIQFLGYAQDVQLSQYYNAPLYLNPAMTGMGDNTRVGVNYRTQWTGIDKPFTSYSVFADHQIEPYNSGVGILYFRDVQGKDRLSTNEFSLLYSYTVDLNNKWVFKPGLQAGFVTRDVSYANSVFGDQLNNNGNTGVSSQDPLSTNSLSKQYLDFSAGGVVYNEYGWFGLSAHHLNQPNQSFNSSEPSPLPTKIALQGGYKIYLKGKLARKKAYRGLVNEISLTPTFNFKKQGTSSQFDVGTYFTYDAFVFGLWYRGLPIAKHETNIVANEAIVGMVGVHVQGLSIGYSYDYTISGLRLGSVHELSLIYEFKKEYKHYKKRRNAPCPKFNR